MESILGKYLPGYKLKVHRSVLLVAVDLGHGLQNMAQGQSSALESGRDGKAGFEFNNPVLVLGFWISHVPLEFEALRHRPDFPKPVLVCKKRMPNNVIQAWS